MANERLEPSIRNADRSLNLDNLETLLVRMSSTLARTQGRVEGVEPPAVATSPQFTLIFLAPKLVIAHKTLTDGVDVVAPELIPDESIVVFFFQQDGSGGHSVTWTDPAFPNKPVMGTAANSFSAVIMRKQAGPLFHQVATEVTDQAVV